MSVVRHIRQTDSTHFYYYSGFYWTSPNTVIHPQLTWWKTTFDGRQLLMEEYLWWKMTFYGWTNNLRIIVFWPPSWYKRHIALLLLAEISVPRISQYWHNTVQAGGDQNKQYLNHGGWWHISLILKIFHIKKYIMWWWEDRITLFDIKADQINQK